MGFASALLPVGPARSSGWLFLVAFVLAVGAGSPAVAQRFLPDDPLWRDPDTMDMPLPAPRSAGEMGPLAFLSRTFGVRGGDAEPAVNVNTVGGVPNSSWYTNRHYRHSLSLAELRRGPNTEPGPVMAAPWRVLEVGRDGALPRAVVRDSTGRRFRLLFDPAAYPEMATGAAMIGSRVLYALGYNVPQHWLRRIGPDQLTPVAADSVTGGDVDSLLALTSRRSDQTYRVLATRIPGVVRRVGPFRFRGTRPDDANDVFPHEHRRELRGLRVVSAWIHHSKIRPRHTLDVGVEEDGRRFVRHYLTDLHLTLGSAGAAPKPPWSGHEYVLEWERVLQRVATLGLSGGDWAENETPAWPALGHFEAEGFNPRGWRPEWPNPAFQRCTPADAFWAAKQVRHLSRADLAAIVGTAEYSSPSVTNHVTLALVRRRNAIARAYLHWAGGLDRFRVRDGRLHFQDLRARYGLAPDSVRRAVTWDVFDNQRGEAGDRLVRTQSARESIALPASRAAFLRATLRTPGYGRTRVFLRRTGAVPAASASGAGGARAAAYEVVGVERTGPSP
jgi:hypothetical protein